MIRRHLWFLVLASWLGGCALIPEYQRPAAPVPDQWPQGPASGDGAPQAAELNWPQFFTDPGLRAVIAAALENNRDLRLAALNVERARALYRIQRDERLPRVDATGGLYSERIPADLSSSGRAVEVEQYSLALGIGAWEIDFFGRLRSLSQSALEQYLATEQARRGAQILLIAEVANAYLALATDRENLELARATLEAQQASYDLMRRRFEVGLIPKIDLAQVRTRVEAARVDVARFSEQTARDANALELLAGAPVSADLLPGTLGAVSPLPQLSAGLPSEVLLTRPDILQAEGLLRAAYADIGAARAALFPRISLTTSAGTASDALSGLFGSGSGAWTFAPRFTLPIFDRRTWAALRVTETDREIALTRYERAIQVAFREVADALAGRGSLDERLAAQEALVEAAAETFRLADARYQKGTDTYLSVLDAQRALYAAQQGLIAIRLARMANQVRLYAVLGGGA